MSLTHLNLSKFLEPMFVYLVYTQVKLNIGSKINHCIRP